MKGELVTTVQTRPSIQTEEEMTVEELMTRNVFSIYQEENLSSVDDIMKWNNIRHVPVVDKNNKLVGLVTHRNLLLEGLSQVQKGNFEEGKEKLLKIDITDIMIKDVTTIPPHFRIKDAAKLIYENKVGCLPVVSAENDLMGILTEADFVKLFL